MAKPSRYQDPNAAVRKIAHLGARAAKPSVKQALKALPSMIDMDKVRELIRHGRPRDIAHTAIDWHHFQQVLRHPFERFARVYEAGAELGQRKINGAFAARRRAVRYRKEWLRGQSRPSLDREETDQNGSGGPAADRDVSECLQVLKRPSAFSVRAAGKFTKEEVGYKVGMPGDRCGECLHFEGSACELVEGEIDPEYRCEIFLSGGGLVKYDPDQPRDELGRWTSGDGGGKAAERAFEKGTRATFSMQKGAVLTPEMHEALLHYKDGGYHEMNKVGGKDADALDKAIEHGRVTKGGLVYRGSSSDRMKISDWQKSIGKRITMNSFTSTSRDKKFAEGWAKTFLFRIYVPKGAKALDYTKARNWRDHEQEVILPRKSNFYVKAVKKDIVRARYVIDLVHIK